VIAACNRDVWQTRPVVRNEAACAFEPEHPGGRFGRNADRVSKAFTEMPPAIADFVRQKLDRFEALALLKPGVINDGRLGSSVWTRFELLLLGWSYDRTLGRPLF
jgi:hypothetical protein